MDRRNFLMAAAATGAGIALSPLSAISLEDDWYTNSRLGIRLRKPADWHFISVTDFNLLMDEQQEEIAEDRESLKAIREVSTEPILVINKYRRPPEDGVGPTIQLHTNPLEPDLLEPVAEARRAETAFRDLHRDYAIERSVRAAVIGGVQGAAWTYVYTMGPGSGLRVRAWFALVRSSKAEFSIGMAGPADGSEDAEAEFEAVWQSLQLT